MYVAKPGIDPRQWRITRGCPYCNAELTMIGLSDIKKGILGTFNLTCPYCNYKQVIDELEIPPIVKDRIT